MCKRLIRGALAGVLAAVALTGAAGAGQAAAAEPWWHLSMLSSPPSKAGGEARLQVFVSNLGDEATSGTLVENVVEALFFHEHKNFIKVEDTLPPGITPTLAVVEGGGTEFGRREAQPGWGPYASFLAPPCTIEGQKISCIYGVPVRPYEQMIFTISAKVEAGTGKGENQIRVSGGGALPASLHRAMALEYPTPGFGVQSYEMAPEEEGGAVATQAGSHPFQVTTTLLFNTRAVPVGLDEEGALVPEPQPVVETKDLRFNLPAGLIGNPTPLPKCSMSRFIASARPGSIGLRCPDNTVVGVAMPIIVGAIWPAARVSYALAEPLYNLEPAVGEPARFGFVTIAGPVILDTSVRTGGDYGVVVTVPNIVQLVGFLGNVVTFWGVPADPRHDNSRNLCIDEFNGRLDKENSLGEEIPDEPSCPVKEKPQPLMINPTSCTGPLHTTIEADSWSDPGKYTEPFGYTLANAEGEPTGLDGCNRLPFTPSIKVAPDGPAAATPSGLSVNVHVPQEADLDPTGLSESTVRDTTVTLPAGVAMNPAGGDGLLACATSEVGLDNRDAPSCPEASKIGTVEIRTPLLPNPLVGAAYLAQQNANPFGSLVALYLVAYDPVSGVRVKIAGKVLPNPQTGQLESIFDETPQLPFEELVLHFFGGSRAPLAMPSLCGGYTTTASIAPWSGNPPASASSEFAITSGPNHKPCASPLPFKPTLTTGSTNLQAAEFTPFTMTMSREDGEQNLDAITLHMPPGLLGTLSGVELCPEPQADEGLCAPGSQIGETTISVGVGGNPYTVFGGKVFITGPYKGAPYGLSIVNPAKAGPFDLERDTSNGAFQAACDCVVVRAKIEVDQTTAALTVTSDTTGPYRIPTILDGIPLQIKHVNVTINRPNFIFNPTNCDRMAITGNLTSAEGAADQLSAPFQITNCATLKFEPQFAVSTSAHASRTNGTSLHVKLTYPNIPYDKRSNVARVKVELPKQLPSRLTTLQKACPDTVFNANPDNCPSASRVGEAVATTPIIPEAFKGPAYFVSHGGARFPELIIVLHGYALTVELHGETFISKGGVTSTTFNTVPDVPIGSFELDLPAGPDSALAANGDLCATRLVMPTTFTAQNGATIEEETPVSVQGCKPEIRVIHHEVAGRRATVVVQVPAAGTLVAGGHGVSRVAKTVRKPGTVTVTLRLSKSEQRFVAHHHGRRLMAPIKLSFTPSHGKRLEASVAVLMR